MLVMGFLEFLDHRRRLGEVDDQRRIGALVPQMYLVEDAGAVRFTALALHLRAAIGFHFGEGLLQIGDHRVVESRLDGALAHHPKVGEPHAVGRQHAGERMDEHAADAECVGHQAGVLATGAAEANQRVLGDVVASLDRNLLDRLGHVLDRDHQETVGGLDGGARIAGLALDLGGQRGELLVYDRLVQGLNAVGAEDAREKLGADLSDHHVGVGDTQRPAPSVACRARVGAARFRADPVARAVEVEDRAAAGRHRVDLHHRRAHTHPRDQRLERSLVLAVVVRDVGRGTTHVERDDLFVAGHGGGANRADDATRRARQDRILAAEVARVGEPAVRLHEHEPGISELVADDVDVAPKDR